MIYEHLIEPEFLLQLANNQRNCQDFKRQFLTSTPRVLSNCPNFKNFRAQVLSNISPDASDMAITRIEGLLNFIEYNRRVKRNYEYRGELSWNENASLVSQSCFADYVVVNTVEPKGFTGKVITLQDFEDGIEDIHWQGIVKKDITHMLQAFGNVLRLSSEITFVDPYFNDRPKVWSLFINFVEASLTDSPTSTKSIRVVYSAEKPNLPTPEYLLDKFEKAHPVLCAQLTKIEFISVGSKHDGEALHNRYLITDLVGINFGFGFDTRESGQTDDISFMQEEQYEVRYEQYVKQKAFSIFDRAEK